MWYRVPLSITKVSEEHTTTISELGTTLTVTQPAVVIRSVLQLLVTVNVVPRSLIFPTMMMEATHFSETSVPTRVSRRHIPEDAVKTSNVI
jgi:hypothetical protein